MSQVQKAADDIKSFVSRIRGFIEVADTLEKIGSIEQAEREAKAKADAARSDAASAVSDLAQKQEKVSKIDEEIAYAKKSAEEIVANANKRAMSMVDEAGTRAQEIVRDASGHKDAIVKEISDLGVKRGELSAFIAEKEKELAAVVNKIAEAREKVASLFK